MSGVWDELVNGPAGSFPRVDTSQTTWTQLVGKGLVRGWDERVGSSNAVMSANGDGYPDLPSGRGNYHCGGE